MLPDDLISEKYLFSEMLVPFSVTFEAELTGNEIVAVQLAGILILIIILLSFLSHPEATVPYELSNEALE